MNEWLVETKKRINRLLELRDTFHLEEEIEGLYKKINELYVKNEKLNEHLNDLHETW